MSYPEPILIPMDGIAPEVAADAFVAPGAVLVGRVRVKAGASVWYNCTLRGDNEWIDVGENSNVQDNSVLHTDQGFPLTIGEGVTIGHQVILHGCTIADGALVGMGSTILNGAAMGVGSILGASALLSEGKDIPAGALAVGAPARIIRQLKENEKTLLRLSAQHYVQNAQKHKGAIG